MPIFPFTALPAQRQPAALGTGKAILIRVICHILSPADLLFELFAFLLIMVSRFYEANLPHGIQVQIVVQTLIPGVGCDFLIPGLVKSFHPFGE